MIVCYFDRKYFKTQFGGTSNLWKNIEWQPADISHPIQRDSWNCGIYVLKVVKATSNRFWFCVVEYNQCTTVRRPTSI